MTSRVPAAVRALFDEHRPLRYEPARDPAAVEPDTVINYMPLPANLGEDDDGKGVPAVTAARKARLKEAQRLAREARSAGGGDADDEDDEGSDADDDDGQRIDVRFYDGHAKNVEHGDAWAAFVLKPSDSYADAFAVLFADLDRKHGSGWAKRWARGKRFFTQGLDRLDVREVSPLDSGLSFSDPAIFATPDYGAPIYFYEGPGADARIALGHHLQGRPRPPVSEASPKADAPAGPVSGPVHAPADAPADHPAGPPAGPLTGPADAPTGPVDAPADAPADTPLAAVDAPADTPLAAVGVSQAPPAASPRSPRRAAPPAPPLVPVRRGRGEGDDDAAGGKKHNMG